ncbi:hypothetical protein KR093_004398 [Drosophila rubida]|uniref:Protein javelin n=1 Tax=Drosophila rubida TaxID=30044 RepID=A0AAD4JW27_9MUSC|nr:hypothetical protein KR093_004398 [Drosophila rubida]
MDLAFSGKDSYSYQHNYVDRVRLEDTNGNIYQQQQQQQHHHGSHHPKASHDPRCPQLRAAGWRHTHKSVSHLDLATSCHGAAGAGIDHRHRQLHHHQSSSHHHQHLQQLPPAAPLTPHAQPHWTQCRVGIAAAAGHGQLRNARSLDYTQLEREENALDIAEFYWHFDAEAPLEPPLDDYAVIELLSVNDSFEPASPSPPPAATPTSPQPTVATTTSGTTTTAAAAAATTTTAVGATATVTATYLDFGSESCSLRRSRSLAVIREETFSDLQIGSANSSRRRSQLIPRARLVNRGFFRESPRPTNAKQCCHHYNRNSLPLPHRLHSKQQQQQTDVDAQSHSSGATTCDSHQQQQLLKQQQQQHNTKKQQQQRQTRGGDFDVYYDNLKRLDALALGLSEQLHPWHNDKSDLESLNSDYFKNSLHQNHAEQLQPSSLEFEALEQAVTLLSERPRLYQSRRQQQQQQHRLHHHCQQRHIDLGGESCPEHSQSSVFPETTTSNSNSDDQTDSPSLSEQEYDLTHIEQIFQQGEHAEAEECYELISLTTTTRTTRFESSEEEAASDEQQSKHHSLATPTDTSATATSDSDGTLKRTHSAQLDKLIAYDSVYLSSEDSSECTLIGESCDSFEQRTSLNTSLNSCLTSTECEEGRSLLHISIEDTVYEPQPKQHKQQEQQQQPEAQIFTQIVKVEQPAVNAASKPRILSVVEKRKQKQEQETVATAAVVPQLKRQATDTFVHKSNLVENQYHSLPDVNIGVSLKVCESIDKELRSSYNQQRQQQRKESKRQQVVTRAETYDSIRRFGRAHQKARQIEYEHEERERQREQEAEKEATKPAKETHKLEVEVEAVIFPAPIEVQVQVEQQLASEQDDDDDDELPLPPPPPPLTEAEDSENDKLPVSIAEQPREAPHIEVANFSKLIERRAQEIRQRQRSKEQSEQPQSFRIIVTDAHNNIIQSEDTKPNTASSPTTLHTHSQHSRSLRRANSSTSGKPAERRVLSAAASIYKARPIKVLATSEKMSRPQILHVVDSSSGHDTASGSLRRRSSSARSIASTVSNGGGEVATEYLQKVDAVKCYWNKLAGNEPSKPPAAATGRLHFQVGAAAAVSEQPTSTASSSADYCSIMPPSIEIVELGDGAQKATLVSAAPQQPPADEDDDEDGDGAQFDHIRYKVLKSQQLIRSNILTARNKKEAQFDGLIQYLQDYSFQELLSNNNVVIVEPVRTKIERPLTVVGNTPAALAAKPSKQQTAAAKKPRQRQLGGAAAKRHFFYQPVRVNRELYEDELPDPDTVRNVRRFFEQHVLPTPGQGILVQSQQKFGGSACQLSPKTRRARGYRYLTIDTSYGGGGGGGEEQPKGVELLEEQKVKHWDNASLSSGISSGDLSSPCGECHNREPDSLTKESPMLEACKGVHVLDVVRRHNSNAANAKARAKLASRRTWCVGATAAGDTRYRHIYEQTKLEEEQRNNDDDDDEGDDGDDDEEEQEQADDDVETDMCESYYVSNDVLAKIRECGSTVTYYGGRVLEPGLPTAAGHSNPQLTPGSADNATRSRVRQIEACNECTEHEPQQQTLEDQQQDSYQAGIKFKLVKSNSCSSRLELAGTEEADGLNHTAGDGTEVVRKMVHHFECNRPAADGQLNVTINSQSTAGKEQLEATATTTVRQRQVTVNNHINMTPQGGERLPPKLTQEEPEPAATYQSQAMNIRLELGGAGRGSDKPNNNSKVCRNRNVDLAYTLAKPSRQDAKGIGNPGTPLGNQKLAKQQSNEAQDEMPPQHVKACQQEVIGREQIIVPIEIHQTSTQLQMQGQAQGQERRLSNASSSASVVDKTVVRHYVANDKSIYERRKYDEIEFEEFEIYDPAKEQERLQQEQQQQQQQQQEEQQAFKTLDSVSSLERRQTTDGELYDSLDDRM